MTKKNENGFGLIEVVMAIIIVMLLGAVVYFYVQANQKKDQASSTAAPSSAVSPGSSTSPTSEESLSSDSVKAAVNNFYSAYWSAVKDSNSKAMDATVAQYGTASFISTYNGIMHGNQAVAGDPVMCVNGSIESDPVVTDVKLASDKATVTVKVSGSIAPTVTIVKDNGVKIDSVSCSF